MFMQTFQKLYHNYYYHLPLPPGATPHLFDRDVSGPGAEVLGDSMVVSLSSSSSKGEQKGSMYKASKTASSNKA